MTDMLRNCATAMITVRSSAFGDFHEEARPIWVVSLVDSLLKSPTKIFYLVLSDSIDIAIIKIVILLS